MKVMTDVIKILVLADNQCSQEAATHTLIPSDNIFISKTVYNFNKLTQYTAPCHNHLAPVGPLAHVGSVG